MHEATRQAARERWAAELGCSSDALGSGTTILTWDGPGVEYLACESGTVVGVPTSLAGELTDPPAFERDAVSEWVADSADVEAVHGPQFVGYCDDSTFAPADGDAVETEASDLKALKAAAPPEEWEQSGLELDTSTPTYAVFEDGDPLAAAQTVTSHGVAGVYILTHPDHRDEGYATAAVSRATQGALKSEDVVEYRTLEEWDSSVALAEGLGFECWGRSLLVKTA